MNTKLLLVAAAILALAATASASARNNMQPKLPGPFSCLDMTADMPAIDAKMGILVGLQRHYKTANGPVMDNAGLTLHWFRPGKRTIKAGMAHPGCWTFVPIPPSRLNYNYHGKHPSTLCASEQGGDYPATDPKYGGIYSADEVKFGACPRIVWRPTIASNGERVRWATIIYQVVYDPARYVGQAP